MSDFIIEITDPQTNLLEIETTYVDIVNNIEIERFDSFNIEIVNTEKVLVGDLPDNIPLSKIKLTGPDSVSSYLDSYEFDCGTP
jgi:hypothetical protein